MLGKILAKIILLTLVFTLCQAIGSSYSYSSSSGLESQRANLKEAKTFQATSTAWVSKSRKNKNFRKSRLQVNNKSYAYIKFSLPRVPKNISKITLSLPVTKASPKAVIQVHPVRQSWNRKTITFQSQPSLRNYSYGRARVVGGRYSIAIPRNAIAQGQVSFRISSKSPRAIVFRTGSLKPALKLSFRKIAGEPKSAARVFAHYFTPFPISIDNKPGANDYYEEHYLSINGENGKHASYGGFLRDRPLPRQASASPTWELDDLRTEIKQAKVAGIDGFTANILSFSGKHWNITLNLMRAAELEGNFVIMPMVDASAMPTASPQETAVALETLFSYASAHKIAGNHVFSSFKAEVHSPAWWEQTIALLEPKFGKTYFIASFLGISDKLINDYKSFSYGVGSWGHRTAQVNEAAPDWKAKAAGLGLKWMPTLAVQDARPNAGLYAEASNSQTYRTGWERAVKDQADFVQIATWNDYSESTSIAPSVSHGSALLTLTKYYGALLKNKPLRLAQPIAMVSHRIHFVNSQPTSNIVNMKPTLSNSQVLPIDRVEALVILPEKATLKLATSTGEKEIMGEVGINAIYLPLAQGRPKLTIIYRGIVKEIISPYRVTNAPIVQDFQYYFAELK